MTSNTGDFDLQVVARAMDAVMEQTRSITGQKQVLVTHSAGGRVGWSVSPNNIAAIAAIEPGGVPTVDSAEYQQLLQAGVPIIIYFGDYIDNGPQDIQSSAFWRERLATHGLAKNKHN